MDFQYLLYNNKGFKAHILQVNHFIPIEKKYNLIFLLVVLPKSYICSDIFILQE